MRRNRRGKVAPVARNAQSCQNGDPMKPFLESQWPTVRIMSYFGVKAPALLVQLGTFRVQLGRPSATQASDVGGAANQRLQPGVAVGRGACPSQEG